MRFAVQILDPAGNINSRAVITESLKLTIQTWSPWDMSHGTLTYSDMLFSIINTMSLQIVARVVLRSCLVNNLWLNWIDWPDLTSYDPSINLIVTWCTPILVWSGWQMEIFQGKIVSVQSLYSIWDNLSCINIFLSQTCDFWPGLKLSLSNFQVQPFFKSPS